MELGPCGKGTGILIQEFQILNHWVAVCLTQPFIPPWLIKQVPVAPGGISG